MNINIFMYIFFHISFYLMTWKAIDYKISLSKFNYLSGYKRKYVIKNLVKCFCLFIWSPVALFVIRESIFYDKWDNLRLHIVGSFYSINDLIYYTLNIIEVIINYNVYLFSSYQNVFVLVSKMLQVPELVLRSFYRILHEQNGQYHSHQFLGNHLINQFPRI